MPDFDFALLRDRFAGAVDLAAFWNDYLDQWAAQPGFMQLGSPAETAEMELLVAYIAGKMLGRASVEAEGMRLAKIAEAGFVHGACRLEGELACILFFEGLERGLLALPESGRFVRFDWAQHQKSESQHKTAGKPH